MVKKSLSNRYKRKKFIWRHKDRKETATREEIKVAKENYGT